MKLEEAIHKLIYHYPDSTLNRTHALQLLYVIIGTGLEWIDGEIQDSHEENYLNSPRKDPFHNFEDSMKAHELPDNFNKEAREIMEVIVRQSVDKHNKQVKDTLDNINQRCKESPIQVFYPMNLYGGKSLKELLYYYKIFPPKDVKPDWLDGAIETCNLILQTDPSVGAPGDNKNSDTMEVAQLAINYISQNF